MELGGKVAVCAFCGERSESQEIVVGRGGGICRKCVRLGIDRTLASAADSAGRNTLPVAHEKCSLCGKPSPPDALHAGEIGNSSRACTTCLHEAYGILTRQPELNTRRELLLRNAEDRTVAALLAEHFAGLHAGEVVTTTRTFPVYLRADLQRALDLLLGGSRCVGLHRSYEHSTCSYAALTDRRDPVMVAPIQYEEVDIGGDETVHCMKIGLWLAQNETIPYALLLSQEHAYGRASGWHIEIAVPAGAAGSALSSSYFIRLEQAVQTSASYRGKVLSLECEQGYRGTAAGNIVVHRLAPIDRNQIILPEKTLAVLERNIFRFLAQRKRLRELAMPIKKGLLFYGPPGTGKTHTIRYLAAALPEHTTLLVTAEQVAAIAEYMALARLLSPAILVIEDVDLIARDREDLDTAMQESLLNRLLNEMDGLRDQSEVLFILTTNRPQVLEHALAGRPGRIDQAIEFPLPDDAGRRRLIDLYRHNLVLSEDTIEEAVRRTEGVSAAFIKELMRRIAQHAIEREPGSESATHVDLDTALVEMLFDGGTLNAALLGAKALVATAPA